MRDSIGRLVKFVSASEAARMIALKTAKAVTRLRNGKVLSVQQCGFRPTPRKAAPTPFTVALYMGQRYTRRDAQSHSIEFDDDKVCEDDQDLFRLAVTDNLVMV